MTRKKLERILFIKSEIKSWRRKLEEISPNLPGKALTGMPTGSRVGSAVETKAIKSIEMEQQIQSLLEELEEVESEVITWIVGIDDSFIRLLIKCRYLDGLTWNNTAAVIGAGTTTDSCKQMLSRWFRENGIE